MINIQKKDNRQYQLIKIADITAFGRKILIIGDSLLNEITRNKLNNSFNKEKYIMNSLSGAKIRDLKLCITPYVEHDKPDILVIHIGSNNMLYNNLDMYGSILAKYIIKIGKKCIDYGVEESIRS